MDDVNTVTSTINFQFKPRSTSQAMTITSVESEEMNSILEKAQPGIQVNISKEAQQAQEQEKQAQEKHKLGQEIANQLRANNNKDEKVEEKSDNPFDRVIAMIKEQIREVKLQLEKLEGDDSEAADKQREMLNAQLLELNGQLLAAYEEKMSAERKGLA